MYKRNVLRLLHESTIIVSYHGKKTSILVTNSLVYLRNIIIAFFSLMDNAEVTCTVGFAVSNPLFPRQ